MKYRDDLKIEFKAEIFGVAQIYHVLMYRISPDQDLTYYEEHSFLGIKFKRKKKFDTSWYKACQYLNYPGSSAYDKPQTNWVLMDNQKEFEEWKTSCKTMGEFFDRLNKINEKEINEWEKDREKYINKCKTWV